MKNPSSHTTAGLLGIVGQIGFMVTVPLVGFALLGRMADKAIGTSPLFFLVGVLVAIVASTVLIYRKTSRLMIDAEKENIKDRKDDSS